MAIQRFNAVGGYSTGLTMTGVIDSLGNITAVGATFSGLIRANAGISAAGGVTFSGNISAPNIVTSVNGATGSVTTYAGTTGNIQFRYGSGVTATSYFSLAQGELDEITDIFTISGPTSGSYSYGNQEAIGLRISRAPGGLGLDEAGGLALNVLGIGDDGTLYGSSLQIITPTADLGSEIYFYPGNNLACIMTPYGVESVLSHTFAAGMYSTNLTAGNTFAGPITGVTATFTGLLSASKGISASGITVGRIVSGGTSGINLEPGSGVLAVAGGISASGGFTFGSPSGTTFMIFSPKTSCTNGGLWIRDGNFQIGGSALSAASGPFFYSPCGERFDVYGYATFNNSYNYQAGRVVLRLNGAPTQSVPILAAYKQTSDGAQLTSTFTTTNMVAGIDQNGALFSSVGISAAGGITFANNVQANGYILTSNARSWFL